jgi:hypothetical protein
MSGSTGKAPWRGVLVLTLAIAATSIVVPTLIGSGRPLADAAPGSGQNLADGQTLTGGQPLTGSPTAAGGPTPASAAATAVTPSSTGRSSPAPSPSVRASHASRFRPIRIDAADPDNIRHEVEVTQCPSCAAGSRVQYVGQGHSLTVPVRNVPVGGRRTLTIVYESDGPRPLDIILGDGRKVSRILPGAESWITPARAQWRIRLPAGDSKLTFFHPTSPAPDLDQIIIE